MEHLERPIHITHSTELIELEHSEFEAPDPEMVTPAMLDAMYLLSMGDREFLSAQRTALREARELFGATTNAQLMFRACLTRTIIMPLAGENYHNAKLSAQSQLLIELAALGATDSELAKMYGRTLREATLCMGAELNARSMAQAVATMFTRGTWQARAAGEQLPMPDEEPERKIPKPRGRRRRDHAEAYEFEAHMPPITRTRLAKGEVAFTPAEVIAISDRMQGGVASRDQDPSLSFTARSIGLNTAQLVDYCIRTGVVELGETYKHVPMRHFARTRRILQGLLDGQQLKDIAVDLNTDMAHLSKSIREYLWVENKGAPALIGAAYEQGIIVLEGDFAEPTHRSIARSPIEMPPGMRIPKEIDDYISFRASGGTGNSTSNVPTRARALFGAANEPALLDRVVRSGLLAMELDDYFTGLTPLQLHIIESVADGLSTSDVIHKLEISTAMYNTQLARTKALLGANSNATLVYQAYRQRILELTI